MVSVLSLISDSFNHFSNKKRTVLSAPTTICITVNLMLHRIFFSLLSGKIIIIIVLLIWEFFTPMLVDVFHWSFSDCKSPLVSWTFLSIPADLSNAVVWMVLTCPPIPLPVTLPILWRSFQVDQLLLVSLSVYVP